MMTHFVEDEVDDKIPDSLPTMKSSNPTKKESTEPDKLHVTETIKSTVDDPYASINRHALDSFEKRLRLKMESAEPLVTYEQRLKLKMASANLETAVDSSTYEERLRRKMASADLNG
jgi:hypothetical protein